MMNFLKDMAFSFIVFGCAISFAVWDYSPLHWSEGTRWIFVIGMLSYACCAALSRVVLEIAELGPLNYENRELRRELHILKSKLEKR